MPETGYRGYIDMDDASVYRTEDVPPNERIKAELDPLHANNAPIDSVRAQAC